jgi:hypothetical protein
MKLRLIGIMLVAAISLTAASTASATSWFSLSSTKGGGTVILKQEGNQVLTTPAGKVTCEEIAASTFIAGSGVILVSSILGLVTYSKCEAFGVAAKVTTGELLLDANGSVRIGNTDKFVITPNNSKCSVQILSENETSAPLATLLGTIKYTNVAGGVQGVASVTEVPIIVRGTGTVCGTNGTAKGSYAGNATSELIGGHISVE